MLRPGVPLPGSPPVLSVQKGLRAAHRQGCLFPLPTHVHLKTPSVAGAEFYSGGDGQPGPSSGSCSGSGCGSPTGSRLPELTLHPHWGLNPSGLGRGSCPWPGVGKGLARTRGRSACCRSPASGGLRLPARHMAGTRGLPRHPRPSPGWAPSAGSVGTPKGPRRPGWEGGSPGPTPVGLVHGQLAPGTELGTGLRHLPGRGWEERLLLRISPCAESPRERSLPFPQHDQIHPAAAAAAAANGAERQELTLEELPAGTPPPKLLPGCTPAALICFNFLPRYQERHLCLCQPDRRVRVRTPLLSP